ncbi:hypothetical protein [Streptomyces sp. NPDC092129]|uniref:hypothetical protein n=1 Tax=Streptomyces sp. NPDC092129 TaxID=3366010 RepID=UPI003807E41F
MWGDLNEARQSAINGQWSIRCDNLEARIKSLTQVVGPTPWDEIQIPLLELGIYQRHAELCIDVPEVQPDMERVAKLRADLERQAAAARR